MLEYRFYLIGSDGHITAAPIERRLTDDSAAMAQAKQLVNGCDVEVWQSTRMVAYVTPDGGRPISDGEPPARR